MRTWLTGLLYGVLFALATRCLASEDWSTAVIAGAVTGPPFGVLMMIVQPASVAASLSCRPLTEAPRV